MPEAAVSDNIAGKALGDVVIKDPKDCRNEGLDTQRALHAQYVLHLLQLQRQAGFLCDITVHVRDRSFKAHKPLLAACSLYFRYFYCEMYINDTTIKFTIFYFCYVTKCLLFAEKFAFCSCAERCLLMQLQESLRL